MCEIEFDEHCEVFIETEVRARKDHTCSCCHGPIHRGDTYVRHFSTLAGAVTSEKACAACAAAIAEFDKEHGTRCNPSAMPETFEYCASEEEGAGDLAMAAKWHGVLDAMKARRTEASDGR